VPGCVTLPKDQDFLKKCKTLPAPNKHVCTSWCHVLWYLGPTMWVKNCRAFTYVDGVGNVFSFIHSTHLVLELLQPTIHLHIIHSSFLDFFLKPTLAQVIDQPPLVQNAAAKVSPPWELLVYLLVVLFHYMSLKSMHMDWGIYYCNRPRNHILEDDRC